MRLLLVVCALAFALAYAATPAAEACSLATGAPQTQGTYTLRFSTAPGYALAVRGEGWGANAQLRLAVHWRSAVERLRLHANPDGSFLVGVNNVGACEMYVFQARDSNGHRASIHTPQKMCAVPAVAPRPVLTVLPETLMSNATNDWRTYRNPVAGYSIQYPAGWGVHESPKENARYVTTFTAPDRSAGVQVSVVPGTSVENGGQDIPNTRCHRVQIGGLSGYQCMDTIGFSLSTMLVAHGKTYTISTSIKRSRTDAYQHMVASFRLL